MSLLYTPCLFVSCHFAFEKDLAKIEAQTLTITMVNATTQTIHTPLSPLFCSKQIVGVVLIFIGSWVIAKSDQYSHLFPDEETLTVVAGVIIGIGSYIFLLGFSACYGALKESTCLLKVVGVLQEY